MRAGVEPRNLAVGDPEVVEVGPAMFSIPQVRLTLVLIKTSFCLHFVRQKPKKAIKTGHSQQTLTN